jgi:hypothetical protein
VIDHEIIDAYLLRVDPRSLPQLRPRIYAPESMARAAFEAGLAGEPITFGGFTLAPAPVATTDPAKE